VSDETTVAVVLGASRYPHAKPLQPTSGEEYVTEALARSAEDLVRYCASIDKGLGLGRRCLNLFNSKKSPSDTLVALADFLTVHLEAPGPRTLLLFYFGHGLILGERGDFHLALACTRTDLEDSTSLSFHALARILKRQGAHYRRVLVLDCCFGGQANAELGPLDQIMRANVKQELSEPRRSPERENPRSGTALLTAASKARTALVVRGDSHTMFSGSLIEILSEGVQGAGPLLTLQEVYEALLARIKTRYGDDWVRPDLHSPDQSDGNVAKSVAIFPNPSWTGDSTPQDTPAIEPDLHSTDKSDRSIANPSPTPQEVPVSIPIVPEPKREPRVRMRGFLFGALLLAAVAAASAILTTRFWESDEQREKREIATPIIAARSGQLDSLRKTVWAGAEHATDGPITNLEVTTANDLSKPEVLARRYNRVTIRGVRAEVPVGATLVANEIEGRDGGVLVGPEFSVVAQYLRNMTVDAGGSHQGRNKPPVLRFYVKSFDNARILARGTDGSPGRPGSPGASGTDGANGRDGNCDGFGRYRGATPGSPGGDGGNGEDGGAGTDGAPGGTVFVMTIARPLEGLADVSGGNGGRGGEGGAAGRAGAGGRGGAGCVGLGGSQPTQANGQQGHPGNPGRMGPAGSSGPPGDYTLVRVRTFDAVLENSRSTRTKSCRTPWRHETAVPGVVPPGASPKDCKVSENVSSRAGGGWQQPLQTCRSLSDSLLQTGCGRSHRPPRVAACATSGHALRPADGAE